MTERLVTPRSWAGALRQWPERLAAVEADPCDGRLQSLGNLLDIADRELVRRWGQPGHEERRAEYRRLLGEMQEANGWVWTETQRRKSARPVQPASLAALAAHAARRRLRTTQSRQTPKLIDSERLPASSGVERPDGGVRASKGGRTPGAPPAGPAR